MVPVSPPKHVLFMVDQLRRWRSGGPSETARCLRQHQAATISRDLVHRSVKAVRVSPPTVSLTAERAYSSVSCAIIFPPRINPQYSLNCLPFSSEYCRGWVRVTTMSATAFLKSVLPGASGCRWHRPLYPRNQVVHFGVHSEAGVVGCSALRQSYTVTDVTFIAMAALRYA